MATVDLRGSDNTIKFPRGKTYAIEVIINDENGDPVNISAYTVEMTVRDDFGEVATVLYNDENGPGQHTDPVSGKTTFTVDDSVTTSLPQAIESDFVYEVEVRDALGEPRESHRGLFTVVPTTTPVP